jgi:predicted dehydrogenase
MKPLRTAILGCGSFAHRHIGNILAHPDELALVALSDHHASNAQALAAKYAPNAAIYTDVQTLLAQEGLELLVICLPPFAHADEVELAAARGVHLLMEKPIALTSEHAWRMVQSAEAAGIHTQVGFMARFGAAVETMKGMMDDGTAGKPGLWTGRYFCNGLHAAWWRMRDKSGGQLVEQVIHQVDLMRYLMGDPTSVFSRQENLFHQETPDYTIEDVSATIVSFASGALGVIAATNGAIPGQYINNFHLVTEAVTADFANFNSATFHMTQERDREHFTVEESRNVYDAELMDLVQAIRTGRATRTPLREGARSLDLALAATRSAEERREVTVGEVKG